MNVIPHGAWSVYGVWGKPAPFTTGNAGIVVHHTVTGITSDPVADVQTVERVTYNRGSFAAIPYSYLIHPTGAVFEGRGTRYRNGANRNDKGGSYQNHNTVSISMIGDYRTDPVTSAMRSSFWQLVNQLKRSGATQESPALMPHSAVAYTECPSKAFDQLQQPTPPNEDVMQTLVSKTSGQAWVTAGNRARPISNVQQWLATFDGPVIAADNMEHVVADLYELVS